MTECTTASALDEAIKTNETTLLPEIKTLPPWFHIENYAKAAELTLGDWGQELSTRLSLKEAWYMYGNLKGSSYKHFDLAAEWEAIQQYGLISASPEGNKFSAQEGSKPVDPTVLFPGVTFPMPAPEPHVLKPLSSLRPITNNMMDFPRLFFDQEAIMQKFHLNYDLTGRLPSEEAERREAWTWFRSSTEFIRNFMGEDYAYLAIDLAMTDEQVLKDFKYWLEHQRRYYPRGHEVILCSQKPSDFEIEQDYVYLYLANDTLGCAVKNIYGSVRYFVISRDELSPEHYTVIKNALHLQTEAVKKPSSLNETTWKAIDELTSKIGYPREKKIPRKNPTQADFACWAEFGILPYWDLMFWANMERIRIRQRVLGYGIFTQADVGVGFDPLDRLRTTRKKTEYVVSQMMVRLLTEALFHTAYE